MRRTIRLHFAFAAVLTLALAATGCSRQSVVPPILPTTAQTCPDLGAAQGVTVYDGRIYLFGDAATGVLREYKLTTEPELKLNPTGRAARLTRGGENLLNHPTGLALHEGQPCFLGNTITASKQGRIYRLDLERALSEGTLDNAVMNDTLDDLAVQGTRPEYVRLGDRFVIATSDYGPGPNFVRFYDPTLLATAEQTSDAGVLLHKVPCGPWVQSLHWIDSTRTLVIVQNSIEGRRWRLTYVSDLDSADYTAGSNVRVYDFDGHEDELEGFARINDELSVFITSSEKNNVTFAKNQPEK